MVRSKIKGKDIIEVLANPSKSITIDLPDETVSRIEEEAINRVVDGATEQFDTLKEMETAIKGKVDKVEGKGLSTNDYTTAEKTKLGNIEAGAQKNVKPDWDASAGDDDEILNKPTDLARIPAIKNELEDPLVANTIYDLTGTAISSELRFENIPTSSQAIMIYFKTGTSNITITSPSTLNWVNNIEPSPAEANTIYVIGILNGVGTFATVPQTV